MFVFSSQTACSFRLSPSIYRFKERPQNPLAPATLKYIKAHVLRASDYLHDQCLNAFLTVASNPEHPLNADWLHQVLSPLPLPDRDAWWSIFLHRQYDDYEHTAVHRLVAWAWADADKSHISDESVRLCATTLTWFLTTSNRFLRDRATKALVSLLTPRIPVLRQVLRQFLKVDDLYILERLYAVAYGCAMRSNDKQAIGALACDVYEYVFRGGKPPVHILLRDYARGVIENAFWRGVRLEIDVRKIKPPYTSEWYASIPSEEEALEYSRASGGDGAGRIYFSVMDSGDFARYVIGTNSYSFDWTSRRLSESPQPTRKQIYESFVASISRKQKKSLDEYANIQGHFEFFLRLDDETRQKEYEELTEEIFRNLLTEAQQNLRKMFRSQKRSILDQHIIPYLSDPRQRDDEHRFDLSVAQRCILRRVFELGWTKDQFETFDRNVSDYSRYGRSASKPERIGKKYQWIAYHEFLARVADNFEFKRDHWIDRGAVYEGPWQIHVRDLDPSCLLKKTGQDAWKDDLPSWWFQIAIEDWGVDWREQLPDIEWIKRIDHLPDIKSFWC